MKRGATPLAMLLLLCLATVPRAQERTPEVQRGPQGVTLDFQNADLRVVISALAEAAGLNVVFSTLPTQTVTLRTSGPVAPQEVRGYLESLARTNGLEIVQEGSLLRISGTERQEGGAPAYGRGAPPPGAAGVRLFVHALRHAQAEAIARTIAALFGIALGPLGGDDSPQSLSQELRQQRLIPIMPQPSNPAPEPAPQGETGRGGLSAGLQSSVQIVPEPRTNSILVRGTASDYETIRAAIQALDVRPLQVVIEVLIAEVRRDRQFGLGISVEVPDRTDAESGVRIGGSLAGRSVGDVTLRVSNLGRIEADVLLRALSASSSVNILSRPVILAQNNQEARILVGSERPFIQLFRALPTDAAVRDQVVQYRDVGTQLTIRPTINADGYVSLAVLQEISSATAETQFGAPVISTREAETELLVRDGHTAVIGGLVDHQTESSASGIPFLKELPLVGHLFRSTQRRRETTELFLFLTPHVIRTDEEMDTTTRQLRDGTEQLRHQLRNGIPLLERRDTLVAPLPDSVPARPRRPDGGE